MLVIAGSVCAAADKSERSRAIRSGEVTTNAASVIANATRISGRLIQRHGQSTSCTIGASVFCDTNWNASISRMPLRARTHCTIALNA